MDKKEINTKSLPGFSKLGVKKVGKEYKIVSVWWRILTFIIDLILGLVIWVVLAKIMWNDKYEFYDGVWYGKWDFLNLFEYQNKWFGFDLTGAEKFGWIVVLFLIILYIINFIWYLKKGKNISQSLVGIEILKDNNFEELSKKELWKRYYYKFLNLYFPIIILFFLTLFIVFKAGHEGGGMTLLIFGGISLAIYQIILIINLFMIGLGSKKQSWYDKKSNTILVRKIK